MIFSKPAPIRPSWPGCIIKTVASLHALVYRGGCRVKVRNEGGSVIYPRSRLVGAVSTIGLLTLYGYVLAVNSWLNEDAHITFRTIDNLIHGYGLTWNVVERVQTFTHPLWLLVLLPFHYFSGEIYYSTIGLSIALGLAAGALIAFSSCCPRNGKIGLLLLIFSPTAIEYSSSGLENPLSNLLLVLFAVIFLKRSSSRSYPLELGAVAGLIATNRLDLILVVLPGLAVALYRRRGLSALALMGAGFLPLALWEIFSLIYFGFPFPNTAYAKLGNHLPLLPRLDMGYSYLWRSLRADHLALPVILASVALALGLSKDFRKASPLALGTLLYLLYLLNIGGDFLVGRFLSGIFFFSVITLTSLEWPRRAAYGAGAAIIIIGLTSPWPPLLTTADRGADRALANRPNRHQIMDGCTEEYPYTGLLADKKSPNTRADLGRWFRLEKLKVAVCSGIGFAGFNAGPGVHFLDPLALADPLLARLPFVADKKLVPGHFKRGIPIGYFDSLPAAENRIADPYLREYYDRLRIITRGEIWSRARIRTIIDFNLGRFDHLRRQYLDSPSSAPVHFTVTDLDASGPPPPAEVNPRARVVMMAADRILHPRQFVLGLDRDDKFEVEFFLGKQQVFKLLVPDAPDYGRQIIIPGEIAQTGFDRFIIFKLGGDDRYIPGIDPCWMAE
jgi:arabinofuranosyltransferase